MTTDLVRGSDAPAAGGSPRDPMRWVAAAVAVLIVGALVVAVIAAQRSSAEADAASARHQTLVSSAYSGMEEAVYAWFALPADQRSDAILTGGASLGSRESFDPETPSVITDVLRTAPEVVVRLTVRSDGHSTVLWDKRAGGSSDTCATSDLMPSMIDCEEWALTPLT